MNGARCLICGVSKRMFSQEERQNQFEKELQNTIYSFARWSHYDGKNTSRVVSTVKDMGNGRRLSGHLSEVLDVQNVLKRHHQKNKDMT